jgi:hypothetical protein
MAYEITDGVGFLKINNNGLIKYVSKPNVIEVSILKSAILKIYSGNSLETIYINHADVSSPITFSADQLLSLVASWIEEYIWY